MTRIFDCFLYNGEAECLEMRIGELGEVVDNFIIVEAPVTHSGKPKPWTLSPVVRVHPKVIYVQVNNFMRDDPWGREAEQRNTILDGLQQVMAEDDDIAIIGDADEIVSADAVKAMDTLDAPRAYWPDLFYYYVNMAHPDHLPFQIAARVKTVRDKIPWTLRHDRYSLERSSAKAWHYSYLGGLERVKAKIRSYAHTENNTEALTSDLHLQRCIEAGVAFQTGQTLTKTPLSVLTMPKGFNLQRHAHLVC